MNHQCGYILRNPPGGVQAVWPGVRVQPQNVGHARLGPGPRRRPRHGRRPHHLRGLRGRHAQTRVTRQRVLDIFVIHCARQYTLHEVNPVPDCATVLNASWDRRLDESTFYHENIFCAFSLSLADNQRCNLQTYASG